MLQGEVCNSAPPARHQSVPVLTLIGLSLNDVPGLADLGIALALKKAVQDKVAPGSGRRVESTRPMRLPATIGGTSQTGTTSRSSKGGTAMAKTVEDVQMEIRKDIDALVASFMKYKAEGFQVSEIASFTFEAGSQLVEAVQGVEGISGEQKKAVVVSTVKNIYKKVNPNVPYIPEPFETMLEDIMIDKALDAFIDFIVDKYKSKGIFIELHLTWFTMNGYDMATTTVHPHAT
jgi:hypothetical protein